MDVPQALANESQMMNREVELIDSAVLAEDVLVVVYGTTTSFQDLHQRQTRVVVYSGDQQMVSGIVKTASR